MDLKDLRNEIDEIDDELVKLFAKRMDVATRIADVKKEKSLPIFVPAREREKLADVAEKAGPEMANYTRVLYSMLFELSRSHQNKLNGNISPLYQRITEAIENTPKLFPQAPMVACQGVEGAYAQIACEKMIKNPFIMYFKNFEAVFTAIDLRKYAKLSMICYLAMGWCVVMAIKPALLSVGLMGMLWIFLGGVVYSIGAILYGLGVKHRYMHSVFHIFVVAGSILQFFGIFFHVI